MLSLTSYFIQSKSKSSRYHYSMGIARSINSFMFFFFLMILSNASKSSVLAEATTAKFTFIGFKENQTDIQTEGASTIQHDNDLLRLTNRKQNVTGTAFYRKPIRLRELTNSSDIKVCSFSTSFVFVILPSSPGNGGFGFTFTLSPTPNRPGAESAQYLGLLNRTNNGNPSNHVFAVEFDTVQGFKDGADRRGNHIGLNFNNLSSNVQEPLIYYDTEDRKEDFQLESGEPIRVLIDYDGSSETLNVTIYPTRLEFKPKKPLISRRVSELSEIVKDEMYVGFTAATGKDQSSAHYVMGWSFSSCGENPMADWLEISRLPPPPRLSNKKGYNSQVIVLIVALSIVTLVLLVLLFIFVMYKRRIQEEDTLEDWEIDYPHRFRYRDLYLATKKFKESEIIGTGGFGIVYRGNLSSSGPIAVKKITSNSLQGVREFMAEIESLGRLGHKNLVNLQGWCKHKNELLLIYDYIPNGSLDSLLYQTPRRNGIVLPWDVRFEIIKGIASGLLYLHEEWEQIVVHRDVKPSNVLIDEDMNAKLGDFGLARLYERGTLTQTTKIVGTLGYMAPELTRNGKGSTASDVFAFGVLLLEIVCGNKPTNAENFFLADWVMEFHTNGGILCVVDQNLGSSFNGREAKLALVVGLLCCHQKPKFRPSMRMVLRYLNGEENVPQIDENWGFSDSSRDDHKSNVVGYVSSDRASSSNTFSSFSNVSSSSIVSGR
ncbi:Concanavalin A-like lectin protein kinase family protein [Arabidopsis thaliana]|nr:Concanavalin A-like lectin protein kinase family protein [Arabidopsis thaliana]ANM65826.1 Concanavalin A-like lectin protein kinase family protein [Arabidopsis thaliana]|eukprot:NP_001327766.1 Concanavalin A-like lectin protein kinase family protein [Arabidopsis thaliana]